MEEGTGQDEYSVRRQLPGNAGVLAKFDDHRPSGSSLLAFVRVGTPAIARARSLLSQSERCSGPCPACACGDLANSLVVA
ncbi:MAG: hypothetical protein ACPIOQ_72700, partial [Promethearchaeia archaeon]